MGISTRWKRSFTVSGSDQPAGVVVIPPDHDGRCFSVTTSIGGLVYGKRWSLSASSIPLGGAPPTTRSDPTPTPTWGPTDRSATRFTGFARSRSRSERNGTERNGTEEYTAVETVLKGAEIALPGHTGYRDKDGVFRRTTRIRWWIDPAMEVTRRSSPPKLSLAEVAMPPGDTLLSDLYVDPRSLPLLGNSDPRPVFIGHYWLTGRPRPLSPAVVCLDYSVARGGSLCAYRWEDDQRITADRFVCVSAASA